MADQGHASFARAEGVVDDRLVNLSVDSRSHFEAVSTFVEGVGDLRIGGIGDRLFGGKDRRNLFLAKDVRAWRLLFWSRNIGRGTAAHWPSPTNGAGSGSMGCDSRYERDCAETAASVGIAFLEVATGEEPAGFGIVQRFRSAGAIESRARAGLARPEQ